MLRISTMLRINVSQSKAVHITRCRMSIRSCCWRIIVPAVVHTPRQQLLAADSPEKLVCALARIGGTCDEQIDALTGMFQSQPPVRGERELWEKWLSTVEDTDASASAHAITTVVVALRVYELSRHEHSPFVPRATI